MPSGSPASFSTVITPVRAPSPARRTTSVEPRSPSTSCWYSMTSRVRCAVERDELVADPEPGAAAGEPSRTDVTLGADMSPGYRGAAVPTALGGARRSAPERPR